MVVLTFRLITPTVFRWQTITGFQQSHFLRKENGALKKILFAMLSLTFLLSSSVAQQKRADKPLSRILFGSCVQQGKPQPIWEKMVAAHPQLTLLIGDNIYGDSADMKVLKQKYAMLGAEKGFQKLKRLAPIMATWDDHDFGVNDGGDDYPQKVKSQKVFLDFWGDAEI
jgi:alkaline phosphatase D